MDTLTLTVDAKYSSPYALSAYVALTAKNLAFDMVTIDLYANQNQSQMSNFARQSLTARVPSLSVKSTVENASSVFSLAESSAICEYIEDVYPAPAYAALYPADLQQRARARQVQAWVRSDLMPIREERPTYSVFYAPSTVALSADAQKAAAKLLAVADTLINNPDSGMFGAWCIADTDLAMMLMRLVNSGDAVPEKILHYTKQQWQHPAVQQWVAMQRPPLSV